MNRATGKDAEYWRDVLTAGGFTSVPRWTRAPEPGHAVVDVDVPDALVTGLEALTRSLDVSPTSPLLAAHAKVLSSLSGEQGVTTGYMTDSGPMPCRLTTLPVTWRALVLRADRTERELLAHQDYPVEALRRELGLPAIAPEAVFDPAGGGVTVRDAALQVAVVPHDDGPVLRLRYRTDLLDEECATRIAGYHLTALTMMAADPGAVHGRQSLLSHEEHLHQVDGLAGPHRVLPDLRFHELFAQRVRMHPDRVAAVQGERRWTYRDLDIRSDRLAQALLGAGLARQGVVAVVSERNLEWLVAILAVFKSGGVYLPVEPRFPADRIATMLSRADCRLVLTGPGSTTTLDRAVTSLPGVRICPIGAMCEQAREDTGPHAAVGSGDLAYVFFTSGSTGEPKGAMIEHAGMLNHLFAKIDDLGIRESEVVAQTAPQCFDISLWQLLSALLTGGRTLLIGQEAILDVRRYVDTLVTGRVGIVQMVPSYLDAVLTFLEQCPREMPDLRCVSVTGEALKKDLVRRWFAVMPGVRLVNAYGLTETSDDTNHAVLERVPDTDGVPIGRPVNNVRVYLVDEHLSPVPLGAPGAIAFSGVSVGRGYINDPERTGAVFLEDPHRAGERLHLGGDYGRWLPDGQLAFLGRRDAQVKIRGFRIEIGEIENALLQTAGVHDAAVVVADRDGLGPHLIAFCSGPRPLSPGVLGERLGDTLPAYMVPSVFHWQETLPLTANGKIDRRELTVRAASSDSSTAHEDVDMPRTPTEQRLAEVWADVLGVPRDVVGRKDNFFDRGGTSLSAVRLAISLDREVSLKDLVRHPVLTDLASLVDGRSTP
ncbi:amino acid adenylation domain-containing protein [Streptomyces sp. NPDC057287]|uniref:non-ribosomal peptide synthetase n=1 Tax=Streptomyces sp. NPDC057287 TaxID=3346086 RepID=UPI003645076E